MISEEPEHTDHGRDTDEISGETTLTRRQMLKVGGAAGAAVAVASTPVSAASVTDASTLSTYLDLKRKWMGYGEVGELPTDEVVFHESGAAEWFVSYSDTAYDDWLSSWISTGIDREEIAHNADRGWVVLSAPRLDVIDTVFVTGSLVDRSGIELVAPNRSLTNTKPLEETDLISADNWESPGGTLAHVLAGELSASGMVFDEAGPYDLADVKSRSRVDNVAETGSGVTVAVVDTGLNYDSTLHGSRVVAGKNTITDTEIDAANDDYTAVEDGNEHGSWVTTAAAGNASDPTGIGVAPGASIIAVKALADDGSGSTQSIVEGIEYAAENGADVINLSLGSPIRADPIVETVNWALTDKDVSAVVVAAGNSRTTTHYMSSPAGALQTIPVASIDSEPADESKSAYYSSTAPHPRSGEEMDIAAGGHRVTAQINDGDQLVDKTLSGTSMAAPVVAGVVALMLEADSSLVGDPVKVKERLTAAAEPLEKCGVTEVGAGRVDAERAVSDASTDADQDTVRDTEAVNRDRINRNIIDPWWVMDI